MRVAIHQPNYMPWTGFFHKMMHSDVFVLFDDAIMSNGKSPTYRTKIMVNGKSRWLSVPVMKKGEQKMIKDTEVKNNINWQKKHIKTLTLNYAKTPYSDEYLPEIEKILNRQSKYLVDYNIPLIRLFADKLALETKFVLSSEISSPEKRGTDKILDILSHFPGATYISGQGEGSKKYVADNNLEEKIDVEWQDYNIKEYPQHNANLFVPFLSVIDLVLNHGQESVKYLQQRENGH